MADTDYVTIRCFDTCKYELTYPDFFLVSDKPSLRKLFGFMFRFEWKNEKTISFFEENLQNLENLVRTRNMKKIADAEYEWHSARAYYETIREDPKKAATREEKERIKSNNAVRKERVKNAESAFRRAQKQAQKDLEKVKQVIAIYLEAKNK